MTEAAMREFEQAIGREYAIAERDVAERYHWCTIPIERKIAAVLRPGSVEEIRKIIHVANLYSVPLYPISTGNNWGYGSANPVQHGNVIVDLARMNRIHEVNTELAYAVIEPGVTQSQLHDHLTRNQIPLWLNPTGAGPSCSDSSTRPRRLPA